MKLIALHSMPRSGSTWLGSIIDSSPNISYKMQPLFSYSLKGFLSEKSNKDEILRFKLKLIDLKDDFLDQNEKKQRGLYPIFIKEECTTVAYKETRYHYILENLLSLDDNTCFVGLIRNPLTHLSSWFNAPMEFKADLWNIEKEWRFAHKKNNKKKEEYYGYEKWKEVALLFHELKEKFPSRVLIISYNELLKETLKTTKNLFNFIGLPITNQTLNFIENSRSTNNIDPYSVFKNKLNDNYTKTSIPDEIEKFIINDLKFSFLNKYLEL